MWNKTGMDEDDEEEDIAEDTDDGDDGVDAAIENFVYKLVNLRRVPRNVHVHHHFYFDINDQFDVQRVRLCPH